MFFQPSERESSAYVRKRATGLDVRTQKVLTFFSFISLKACKMRNIEQAACADFYASW